MRINNNLMAMNTHRQMGVVNTSQSKSMEKLSSGYRINRAGDDAAGLAISEKMRAQVRGLNQASRNAQDGISLVQTAEGGLQETQNILQRMNELATQAANETLSASDRTAVADEITQLNSEINRISDSTKFNGEKLLDGNFGAQLDAAANSQGIVAGNDGVLTIDVSGAGAGLTFTLTDGSGSIANGVTLTDDAGNSQTVALADNTAGTMNFDKLGVSITVDSTWDVATLAASTSGGGTAGEIAMDSNATKYIQIGSENDANQRLGIAIGAMDATTLNVATVDVSSSANARQAMTDIQSAIDTVSGERSKLGAYQNRLEHTISNLDTSSENLQAAESRIRDVDMAAEMMEFTKNNILSQAAQSMLAQANQAPQGVLQLLR